MPIAHSKKDHLMTVIFDQLAMLQELSIRAEETELATELSATFLKALERYCEGKRTSLATTIDIGPADKVQGSPRIAGNDKAATPIAPEFQATA